MPELCLNCGEKAVEWDNFHGTDHNSCQQKVCHNCGTVSAETALTHDYPESQAPTISSKDIPGLAHYLPVHARSAAECKNPYGKQFGLKKLRLYAQGLKCSKGLTSQATELYERLFNEEYEKVRTMQLESKSQMAASCLYIVCHNNMWPVTISDICNIAGFPRGKFVSSCQLVQSILNVSLEQGDLEELIPSVCPQLSRDVHSLIKGVLQICKEAYISSGRNPQCVIMAAAYHAWRALEGTKSKRKITNVAFIRKYNLHKNSRYNYKVYCKRVKEMEETLCKLARQLPYVVSEVNADNFYLHLEDVISHHRMLMDNALAELRSAEEEDKKRVDTNLNEMHLWKKRLNDEELEAEAKLEAEKTAKYNARITAALEGGLSSGRNLDDEELGSDDLSESEISLYVRSDQIKSKVSSTTKEMKALTTHEADVDTNNTAQIDDTPEGRLVKKRILDEDLKCDSLFDSEVSVPTLTKKVKMS